MRQNGNVGFPSQVVYAGRKRRIKHNTLSIGAPSCKPAFWSCNPSFP